MSETTAQRRLSAILVADVVGFSRLTEQDEASTLAGLKQRRRNILKPLVRSHEGRIVKFTGDAVLVEFASAVSAVGCAIELQEAMAFANTELPPERHIVLRIGINLGDIIIDGGDIYGDSVNIAARLERIAEPGGVAISDDARRQLHGRLQVPLEDIGPKTLKNIQEPVRVWLWSPGSDAAAARKYDKPASLPDKPSIAVLPFTNLSGDLEQEYLADGIVEDLTTALSRFPWLFVISRNSCFTYKNKSVQVKQVARDLGVRYVVEGSVRRSSTRLRVAVQLIDAATGHTVWAERYDRGISDLFELQDEIARCITGTLVPALGSAERKRAARKARPGLDAWEAFQRGLTCYYRPYSTENHAAARRWFDQAIELDPAFADAHAMIGLMGAYAVNSGQSSYTGTDEEILAEAHCAAEQAVALEDHNALAHIALGRVSDVMGKIDRAVAECQTAVTLNPNLAFAHFELGFVLHHAGRPEDALPCIDAAIRLSPNDPSRWNFYFVRGMVLLEAGRYEEAIAEQTSASQLRPSAFWPLLGSAVACVNLGRMEQAREAVKEALARKPDLSLSGIASIGRRVPGKHWEIMLDGLGKAGLPE